MILVISGRGEIMLEKIERYASEYALSDIHIRSDQPVAIREDGIIRTFVEDVPTRGEVESFISSCMDPVHSQVFDKKKMWIWELAPGRSAFVPIFSIPLPALLVCCVRLKPQSQGLKRWGCRLWFMR
jgi:hypothetical protein